MFSTNPFSHLASSNNVFPSFNSFLDHENDDFYINHNYHQINTPFVSGDVINPYSEQDFPEELGFEECEEYNQVFGSEVKIDKISKKDHHSKIYTAQGLRDRRVRLSIDVSRKFFYLQDLLGFDKASKTLDWLFKKSKTSIDELVNRKAQSSSSTASDQSEVVFLEIVKERSEKEDKGLKKKHVTKSVEVKKKKLIRNFKSASHVTQSRVEARARARERTKEKLNTKKLDNEFKSVHGDCCSSNLAIQSSFCSGIESQNDYNGKIGESDMETLYSYQHYLAMSNDSSCLFEHTYAHE